MTQSISSRGYSAFHASPFAKLRAALEGVVSAPFAPRLSQGLLAVSATVASILVFQL
jgi:hypothetical protein